MAVWELAQLNIAESVAPLDSPELADFVANLDRINELAEKSPGFVWRFTGDADDASLSLAPFAEDTIVNLSVWQDIDSLHDYVYRTAHTEVMRRRHEWFVSRKEASAVLWWVPEGHRPDFHEAHQRLMQLNESGPSDTAFTFKQRRDAPQT